MQFKPNQVHFALRSRGLTLVLSGLLLVAAGCGGASSSSGGSGGGGGSSTTDGGVGNSDMLVGELDVTMVAPVAATASDPAVAGYTSVLGSVSDGVTPATSSWTVSATDGDCTLRVPLVPFCSTPCGSSAACVAADTCVNYPTVKSVGSIDVKGITLAAGGSEFTMTAVNGTYQSVASLAYPGFSEGGAVTMTTGGGDYDKFTLSGKGIAPLVVTSSGPDVKKDTAQTITWTPPTTSGISTIEIKLDIGHHGGEKGQILCDTSDSGSLTISASLMNQLIALGVAGFPSITVTRQSIGSTTIAPGRVDLKISQSITQDVTVDGVTSCNTDSDCPTGETCQSDLTCQ
jgi:hypothetical protein